jgi:hypothetical protein
MKPRLLILIVLAGGLAVYFASASNKPAGAPQNGLDPTSGDDRNLTERQRRESITDLAALPLAGDEPAEPADLSVTVAVDTSSGKNRLYVTLSEAHGYYVESFRVRLWYKDTPDTGYADSSLRLQAVIDKYIRANETLRDCLEVVPAELASIGGDIGSTEDWRAEIAWHGRARAQDPDPLPYRPNDGRCDG